jgi:hypothetical protein
MDPAGRPSFKPRGTMDRAEKGPEISIFPLAVQLGVPAASVNDYMTPENAAHVRDEVTNKSNILETLSPSPQHPLLTQSNVKIRGQRRDSARSSAVPNSRKVCLITICVKYHTRLITMVNAGRGSLNSIRPTDFRRTTSHAKLPLFMLMSYNIAQFSFCLSFISLRLFLLV